jgi:hypothetical protein
MTVLRFSDGVNIDTSGPYRILHLKDGYYVVGEGTCTPVNHRAEAEAMLAEMKGETP